MRCIAPDVNTLYRQVLGNLTHRSCKEVSPRGMLTHEDIGNHLTLTNPNQNILTLPARKTSYHFMCAEFLWMLSGQNLVGLIEPFNKSITMAADEGQYSFAGAYGPKIIEQVPYVIDTLRKDPDSRQAVLSIWRERPRESRDIPCTVAMQFFIREKALEMCVYMRSNDAWLGLPYDVFNFTMLQRFIASCLDVGVGTYHHFVGSLHLYDRDYAKAENVAKDRGQYHVLSTDPFTPTSKDELPRVFAAFTELATVASAKQKGLSEELYSFNLRNDWMKRYSDVTEPWKGMLMLLTTRVWPRQAGQYGNLNPVWRKAMYPTYPVVQEELLP